MKNTFFITAIILTLLLVSCNNKPQEQKAALISENIKLDSDTDPVCKMNVKKNVKDTAVYQGKTYGFCNVACKEAFKNSPQEYLK